MRTNEVNIRDRSPTAVSIFKLIAACLVWAIGTSAHGGIVCVPFEPCQFRPSVDRFIHTDADESALDEVGAMSGYFDAALNQTGGFGTASVRQRSFVSDSIIDYEATALTTGDRVNATSFLEVYFSIPEPTQYTVDVEAQGDAQFIWEFLEPDFEFQPFSHLEGTERTIHETLELAAGDYWLRLFTHADNTLDNGSLRFRIQRNDVVPEPSSNVIWLVGGLMLFGWRRVARRE